jgi:hypothetical protein
MVFCKGVNAKTGDGSLDASKPYFAQSAPVKIVALFKGQKPVKAVAGKGAIVKGAQNVKTIVFFAPIRQKPAKKPRNAGAVPSEPSLKNYHKIANICKQMGYQIFFKFHQIALFSLWLEIVKVKAL